MTTALHSSHLSYSVVKCVLIWSFILILFNLSSSLYTKLDELTLVIDASSDNVIAFSISEGRSGTVEESLILPGLAIALVESALKRSQTEDDGAINRWLLQTFSQR